jgi:hypothetical protein
MLRPSAPKTSPAFAFALWLTSRGAQVGLTVSIALFVADIASQLTPRHPGLIFAITGGTGALLAWQLLGHFFRWMGGAHEEE